MDSKKGFYSKLKTIYQAPDKDLGRENMETVKEKWDNKYPNALESLNSRRSVFPSYTTFLDSLYLTTFEAPK
ncbi:transposase [Lutispora thermophila]|uniref:transposase n=1 Tax=Lutispora thermophila TaxID=288966 RepID=UPI00111493A4